MGNPSEIVDQLSLFVTEIISGTFFIVFGLGAFAIAAIRRDKNTLVLFWLGMWSGTYGLRLLIMSPPVNMLFPTWFQIFIPWIDLAASYFILVFALLTWKEFTRYSIRQFLQVMLILSIIVALAGIVEFLIRNKSDIFINYNQLLATITLLVLIFVICVKSLADRYLILPNRGLLMLATLLFAAEALFTNIAHFFNWPTPGITGWLGFAILLSALAISALQFILASEKRLLTIESELETARKIQFSILPEPFPKMPAMNVAAAYYPMTAVAGDFYDYLIIDKEHFGFLVADVSGHGVPAALIASMVKIAIQSAGDFADDPAKVLKHLAHIIGTQLQGQFITAAYLYIDLKQNKARYSAAGHPPLIYQNIKSGRIKSIESNGLLISAFKETNYPLEEIDIFKGDRFILYTDGLTEAENKNETQFGDDQFEELLNVSAKLTAAELSGNLYNALQKWIGDPANQQDDFTWVIIDVKE